MHTNVPANGSFHGIHDALHSGYSKYRVRQLRASAGYAQRRARVRATVYRAASLWPRRSRSVLISRWWALHTWLPKPQLVLAFRKQNTGLDIKNCVCGRLPARWGYLACKPTFCTAFFLRIGREMASGCLLHNHVAVRLREPAQHWRRPPCVEVTMAEI